MKLNVKTIVMHGPGKCLVQGSADVCIVVRLNNNSLGEIMPSIEKRPMFVLSVGDVQYVAVSEFDKELSDEELEQLRGCIGDSIPWYDCVLSAIDNHIRN